MHLVCIDWALQKGNRRVLSQNADLRLQPYAAVLLHRLLYGGDQGQIIGGSAVFVIDQKARVQGGDAGSADPQTLEPCIVDQRPGKLAFGPLEGAAAAGDGQGLLFPATGGELPNGGADGLQIAGVGTASSEKREWR